MERDSLLYIVRRKGQVLAHKFIPDEIMSKFYYKIVLKKSLNLTNPQTFNEKLQWLKLNYFPKQPLVVKCADKYAVREYITEQGYKDLLVSLLDVWKNADEIKWEELPNKFVLKCNHGCAYNIVCDDKNKLNVKSTVKQLNKWLKEDFGAFNIELHYSKIIPRLITCEEYLGECIIDYKFFCFKGEPKYVYVSNNLIHDRQAQIGFFNIDGSRYELKRSDYANIDNVAFPDFYLEMLEVAKNLSKDFLFVRVDFFIANNRFYFAELTFTPSACMMPFTPEKYDLEWGKLIDIDNIGK